MVSRFQEYDTFPIGRLDFPPFGETSANLYVANVEILRKNAVDVISSLGIGSIG